jgi:hypothetical protein
MPIEIYDQCRRMVRRSRLDEDDFTKWELAELSRDLPLAHPDDVEMLAITDYLLEIERRLPYLQIAFSSRMRRAILASDYTVKPPYARPPVTTPTAEGDLFIATSWSRPGFVMLGASHVPLDLRLGRYAERYGYPVDVFWSARVSRPWCLLAVLRPKLAHLRAADAPYEDPGEWYRMTPEDVRTEVQRILAKG